MARPTVALVNNAQREHLEFMQTVQAVALENGAVLSALEHDGIAVFPSDDAHTTTWRHLVGTKTCVEFSLDAIDEPKHLGCFGAQWESGAWTVHARGLGADMQYRLHIAGRHNVKNSLAAAACTLAAGVPASAVMRGLEAFVPVKGRSRALSLQLAGHEITVVDDTYNANPDSVRAAIDVLAELPSPRALVLGDMGEVGQEGPAFHAEAGRYAHTKGIEHFFALGELARESVREFPGARHFETVDELNAAVCTSLPLLRSVLVKGSRFMRMERVVQAVLANAKEGHAD
jgi:UDP-N-acetylmuramoyl-tripeptide--D-alanyl-D-alanine ligase